MKILHTVTSQIRYHVIYGHPRHVITSQASPFYIYKYGLSIFVAENREICGENFH